MALDVYGNYQANLTGLTAAQVASIPGNGSGNLHGSGAPAADLGSEGNTYVDDDTGQLYWKGSGGWYPQ